MSLHLNESSLKYDNISTAHKKKKKKRGGAVFIFTERARHATPSWQKATRNQKNTQRNVRAA